MQDGAAMLIVKDDPEDVNLLRRAMRKAEVQVTYEVASDGDAAVARLGTMASAGDALRVVLLDLKLPRRSGFDVLAWMRAHPTLRRVPVIVLTSSAINTDLQRAYDLGANSYLVKPVDSAAFVTMVGQIDSYWLRTNRIAT